jgi:hypothetical protein
MQAAAVQRSQVCGVWMAVTGQRLDAAAQARFCEAGEVEALSRHRDRVLRQAATVVLRRRGELRLNVWLDEAERIWTELVGEVGGRPVLPTVRPSPPQSAEGITTACLRPMAGSGAHRGRLVPGQPKDQKERDAEDNRASRSPRGRFKKDGGSRPPERGISSSDL